MPPLGPQDQRPDPARPRVLEQVKRSLRCVELRRQGKSYREIAAETGLSHTACRRLVLRWLEAAAQELKEQSAHWAALHVARTERYLDALEKRVSVGDARAIEVALKVLERQARLLGLDAPVKVEQRVEVLELTDDELRAEEERLRTLPPPPAVPALLPGESAAPPALVLDAEVVGEVPAPTAPAASPSSASAAGGTPAAESPPATAPSSATPEPSPPPPPAS